MQRCAALRCVEMIAMKMILAGWSAWVSKECTAGEGKRAKKSNRDDAIGSRLTKLARGR